MLSKVQAQNASDKDINITEAEGLPRDSVSCISWSPNEQNPTFATSDWDSWIRIYNVDPEASTLVQKSCLESEHPCLSMNWHDDEKTLFTGGTDGSVKSYHIESGVADVIGYHEGLVKGVHWMPEVNALLTVSCDKTIRFWDPRQENHVAVFQLPHKVFCSDLMYPYLGLGLSEAKVLFLDLTEIQRKLAAGSPACLDSRLGEKTQVTFVKLFSGGNNTLGMATSGNDGRCDIATVKDDPSGFIKLDHMITWKAHKTTEPTGRLKLYPTSSIGFHPRRGSDFIYTTGGDGKMNFWDMKKKDRIAEFDFKGIPVTNAEIDPTGRFLAYSLGYDWARGIQEYQSHLSKVCVHVLLDKELERNYQGDSNYPLKYQ